MTVEGFGYDYAKWTFRVEQDLFHQHYEHFRECLHRVYSGGDINDTHHVHIHGGYGAIEKWYTLEVWGDAAEVVKLLVGPRWWTNLDRVDVKGVVWDLSPEQNAANGLMLAMQGCQYMVNTYNQKERRKKNGKSAGGKGFAIGSHKSDLRISAYNRPNTDVGLEFQCSGAMLTRLQAHTISQFIQGVSNRVLFTGLAQSIQAVGYGRFRNAFEKAGLALQIEAYLPRDPGDAAASSDVPTAPNDNEPDSSLSEGNQATLPL